MEQRQLESLIKIYPTVIVDELKIDNLTGQILNLKILDTTGKNLLEKNVEKDVTLISMEKLSAGIYFLKLNNDYVTFTKKMIKIER